MNSDPDLDGDGNNDITGDAKYSTISAKFNDLQSLDNDDFLLVYLTGPLKEVFVEFQFPVSYDYYDGIAFWGRDLRSNNSLTAPMSNLNPGNLLFIDARKRVGIDIDDYEASDRYIINSNPFFVEYNIFGNAKTLPRHSYFGEYFLNALISEDSNGNAVYADFDNSGITTIEEARRYAADEVSPNNYSDYDWDDYLKACNISLNGYEGCQSTHSINSGVITGTLAVSRCNVEIYNLVVDNGGELQINADGNVLIENNFGVITGGTLVITNGN